MPASLTQETNLRGFEDIHRWIKKAPLHQQRGFDITENGRD